MPGLLEPAAEEHGIDLGDGYAKAVAATFGDEPVAAAVVVVA